MKGIWEEMKGTWEAMKEQWEEITGNEAKQKKLKGNGNVKGKPIEMKETKGHEGKREEMKGTWKESQSQESWFGLIWFHTHRMCAYLSRLFCLFAREDTKNSNVSGGQAQGFEQVTRAPFWTPSSWILILIQKHRMQCLISVDGHMIPSPFFVPLLVASIHCCFARAGAKKEQNSQGGVHNLLDSGGGPLFRPQSQEFRFSLRNIECHFWYVCTYVCFFCLIAIFCMVTFFAAILQVEAQKNKKIRQEGFNVLNRFPQAPFWTAVTRILVLTPKHSMPYLIYVYLYKLIIIHSLFAHPLVFWHTFLQIHTFGLKFRMLPCAAF